jgi:iron-sulfur cluster insertion protein
MFMIQDFFISDSAAQRITHLLRDEPQGAYLRISVEGGGCSGFQYKFEFDASSKKDDDRTFTHHNAEVVIDSMSLDYIKASMIDYVENLGASYFEIKNPQAAASCGCGNSFAL